ncbi:prepilin-type N-terminal cleavage/methylation domain-containing protein [Pseudoalteromonas sp. KG3]|uniref:prepilin-type N-terminal cleavage/methylation domain-containing protein n=1 Tax=Pseudoalteromonas sp. KG3 TaxID=2951137 RepID=UPI0026596EA7|nr:prepilin-type N-terminal cleavage/methylation domain-containing protein [Pseudoalteromonas sp. KG3]WKD22053.1 prepilin-type N-terminal cleavage/methylation domain-containing protein [Pseudoalteromonas sp. KG3]
MVTQKAQQGFTLIELMLATTLLMLVLFAGYYGYGLFADKWQKRTQYFWQQTQQTLAFDVITRVFESTFPYIVKSDNNEPAQYFSGDQNRVIFITTSPLFSNKTSVVEFKILQNADGYSLAYNEASMSDNLLLNQSDVIIWQHQIVLLENLQDISFEYYGWKNLEQVLSVLVRDDDDENSATPSFYQQHIMEERRVLPVSLYINLKAENGEQSRFPVSLPTQAASVLVDYIKEEI